MGKVAIAAPVAASFGGHIVAHDCFELAPGPKGGSSGTAHEPSWLARSHPGSGGIHCLSRQPELHLTVSEVAGGPAGTLPLGHHV